MFDTIPTVTQLAVSLTHEHGMVTCYIDEAKAAFPLPLHVYVPSLRLEIQERDLGRAKKQLLPRRHFRRHRKQLLVYPRQPEDLGIHDEHPRVSPIMALVHSGRVCRIWLGVQGDQKSRASLRGFGPGW